MRKENPGSSSILGIAFGVVFAIALLAPLQIVADSGTDDVEAHDAYLLGLAFYYRRTPNSYAKAKKYLERAIELDPSYIAPQMTLAKIYSQSNGAVVAITFPQALGISWLAGAPRARKLLAKVQDQPNTDVRVVRSWLALRKHQHERAIAEAEQALELSPSDVDALEALSMARTYAGQPKVGFELAQQSFRQNPAFGARPFLLMGLAKFALDDPGMAAEYIGRAFELGSEETDYAGIQAAAYGELGNLEEAKAALDVFWQGFPRPANLAQSMLLFPFSDHTVTERLAEGFKSAGVSVGIGGYLPLHETNRVSGSEMEAVLIGKEIEGTEIWADEVWQRKENAAGEVEYSGFQLQPGIPWKGIGKSRIEDDMLCEEWPEAKVPMELCSVIYRIPEGDGRIRWGDYVMVTDLGPHPFEVLQ